MAAGDWHWHAGNALTVFHDGSDYWLGDGFHRIESASRAGILAVPCEVREGGRREAVRYACGANASHGLRRTRDDVRRAIEILLRDEEWGQWSDREIARRVGCSPTTVGALRSGVQVGHLNWRKGADGKTYPAGNGTTATQTPPARHEPVDDAPFEPASLVAARSHVEAVLAGLLEGRSDAEMRLLHTLITARYMTNRADPFAIQEGLWLYVREFLDHATDEDDLRWILTDEWE